MPPTTPPNPELVAATLALWLFLTTSPTFVTSGDLSPVGWSTNFDDLPENMKALEAAPGNKGVIQRTMTRLANSEVHRTALITARDAFQLAFSPDRNENTITTDVYPGGGTCPHNIGNLTGLVVSYPAQAAAQAERLGQ